jgi:hypothetical protein
MEWWSDGRRNGFLFACIRGCFTGSSLALERRTIPIVPVENLAGLYVLHGYYPSLFRKNKLPVFAVLHRKDFT